MPHAFTATPFPLPPLSLSLYLARARALSPLSTPLSATGRATIPDDIKADLLERIRKFLASN